MSTGNVIAPIECLVNKTRRHTPLSQNGYLQFRSRIVIKTDNDITIALIMACYP
jgi:hypothetical protein